MVLSLVLRFALWKALGEVQYISYWTIAGCIDFFAAGMLWHELAGQRWTNRRPSLLFAVVLIGFAAIWHAFNIAGGFYNLGGYPSPSPVWIVLPAIQGLAFGALIVSYEKLTFTMPGWLDRGLAKIGEVSYSIYLVHFIVVRTFAKMCGHLGLDMSNFTLSLIFAIATFPIVVALSLATYELIEKPFLKMRGKYAGRPSASDGPASAGARLVQA